jgi:purine nucleosidase
VTALSAESSTATLVPHEGSRGTPRRVYTDLDFRLIAGDMLARFRLHESRLRKETNGELPSLLP